MSSVWPHIIQVAEESTQKHGKLSKNIGEAAKYHKYRYLLSSKVCYCVKVTGNKQISLHPVSEMN